MSDKIESIILTSGDTVHFKARTGRFLPTYSLVVGQVDQMTKQYSADSVVSAAVSIPEEWSRGRTIALLALLLTPGLIMVIAALSSGSGWK